MVQITGVATISENGFSFNTGLSENENVLDKEKTMHGVMKISKNACADFIGSQRVILPPEINSIAKGDGYSVKRTTRNYIIQLKVPVVETRKASQERLKRMLTEVLGDITLDRKELI